MLDLHIYCSGLARIYHVYFNDNERIVAGDLASYRVFQLLQEYEEGKLKIKEGSAVPFALTRKQVDWLSERLGVKMQVDPVQVKEALDEITREEVQRIAQNREPDYKGL